MKLRMKGDSVRLRVTRPEVEALAGGGFIEERTHFGGGAVLICRLESGDDVTSVSAELDGVVVRVRLPRDVVKRWARDSVLGIEGEQQVGEERVLKIIVEKDLECRHGESVAGAYPRQGE